MKTSFKQALYFDLLDAEIHDSLLARPERLEQRLAEQPSEWVVIDEIQKIPRLLDQVHRLIEKRKTKFALSGSSARKLMRGGANLLAARAVTMSMNPLTVSELGDSFDVRKSLAVGHLPLAQTLDDPKRYLRDYVHTYLREEIQNEGLTRNISSFARFLETMSLSNAQQLNLSAVARDASVERKTTEEYVTILEDLLLGFRLPAFLKRAKIKVRTHPKFFFFDVGVFRTIRPRGPLDTDSEIDGAALETLFLQEARAYNLYDELDYSLHFWRSDEGAEVDFVFYGERGLLAFEIKRAAILRDEDFAALHAFRKLYPMAKSYIFYGGTNDFVKEGIRAIPYEKGLRQLRNLLSGE